MPHEHNRGILCIVGLSLLHQAGDQLCIVLIRGQKGLAHLKTLELICIALDIGQDIIILCTRHYMGGLDHNILYIIHHQAGHGLGDVIDLQALSLFQDI